MVALRFERVLALPVSPVANTVYFVRPAGQPFALQYVTGNDAIPIPVGQAGTPTPAPTLGTVTLSGSLQIGVTTSGTLLGTTALSTVASNIPGITFNSGARTYSGTPTGSAQTITNGIVETLVGAIGSPKSSPVTVAAAALVAPGITTAPSFTGTAQEGQTLAGTRGTYTNSPTSYTNQWQRSANGTTWTNISGATALNYTLVTADVSNVVRLTEIATNATGSSASNPSAASGTVAAATGAATAPTLTRTSADGANPMSWSAAYADMIPDSDIIQMRWTTNGGTTYSYATDHLFTSDDYFDSLDGAASFTWNEYQAAAAGFANGTVQSVQEGVKRGTAATVWSNSLTQTVTPVAELATAWATTTGVDKSQFVSVSASPSLSVTGQGGFNNAPISARATRSRSGKRQFQVTLTANAGSRIWVGLDDGTTNLNSGFPRPGSTNSAGISFSVVRADTWNIYVGGAVVQSGGAGGAMDPLAGDVITCTFDTAAGSVSFYTTRAGTTTQFGTAQAVSLSSWKANVGFEDDNTLTAKFAAGQARALSSGYVPYDN